jgi:hypothetical protein
MADLDTSLVLVALRRLAEVAQLRWVGSGGRLVLMGGASGMLAGALSPARVTADCDVVWSGDAPGWAILQGAARQVAAELGLPANWLNDDVRMYVWRLPVGWFARCEPVLTAGPLEIVRLSRGDLIGAKVIAGRVQDIEDVRAMRPTWVEFDAAEAHIERLEGEDLDRSRFERARAIVGMLRGTA